MGLGGLGGERNEQGHQRANRYAVMCDHVDSLIVLLLILLKIQGFLLFHDEECYLPGSVKNLSHF